VKAHSYEKLLEDILHAFDKKCPLDDPAECMHLLVEGGSEFAIQSFEDNLVRINKEEGDTPAVIQLTALLEDIRHHPVYTMVTYKRLETLTGQPQDKVERIWQRLETHQVSWSQPR